MTSDKDKSRRSRSEPMTAAERRGTGALAGIFALRMFGLFLILPVFALYARDLPGSTPIAVGLALGVYGLSQALLQIPFGLASDRFGRKPLITLGLVIFIAGSVIAAKSTSIEWIIVGRALQGAGAVASAILALTSDLTRDAVRTKAMALIGVSIGFSFLAALMIAPALTPVIGVPGLFWMTAGLATLSILVLWFVVPEAPVTPRPKVRGAVRRVVTDAQLMRLNFGIFVLHATLTALFVAVPVMLVDDVGMANAEHWKVYVPVMLASIPALVLLVRMSHAPGGTKKALLIGVASVIVSFILLAVSGSSFWILAVALTVFFSGFNSLEAMLPSLTSRLAPADIKGTALGAFNTLEFLGIFVGGVAGGAVFGAFGPAGVFGLCAVIAALWLLLMFFSSDIESTLTSPPETTQTLEIHIGPRTPDEAEALEKRLAGYEGVRKVTVNSLEGAISLTIDPDRFDRSVLDEFVETVNIRASDLPAQT